MFEAEINRARESARDLPPGIRDRFRETREHVLERSVIPWGEHCTECAMPHCYTTCDLFTPRDDGRCRRFADGMVRVPMDSVYGYILKIDFKRWAKLWSVASAKLETLGEADIMERRDRVVGRLIQAIPVKAWRMKWTRHRYDVKKRRMRHRLPSPGVTPDGFCIEAYNPQQRGIDLTVVMRPDYKDACQTPPYQARVCLPFGHSRHLLRIPDISRFLNVQQSVDLSIVPNTVDDGVRLYFGLLDFVRLGTPFDVSVDPSSSQPARRKPAAGAKKRKCVVWDLDNTLWDGILVEDGPSALKLRDGVKNVIETLDARGIVQSVASKNNETEALDVLRTFELDRYFLTPQISWNPKSKAVARIASDLNIGVDTLLFVDDSAFERSEVESALPGVAVIDAADIDSIPSRPDCDVPVTEESRRRREMYREQFGRNSEQERFDGDYVDFLRHCCIEIQIRPLEQTTLPRVYELSQRTNQMNFSGNRYTRDDLDGLVGNARYRTYVIRCTDRFGSYGIVGFCIFDTTLAAVTDLMFSCRVQAKHVEHACLAYLIEQYRSEMPAEGFAVIYRPTERNAPSARVFQDLGFEQEAAEDDEHVRLVYPLSRDVPRVDEIKIVIPGLSFDKQDEKLDRRTLGC